MNEPGLAWLYSVLLYSTHFLCFTEWRGLSSPVAPSGGDSRLLAAASALRAAPLPALAVQQHNQTECNLMQPGCLDTFQLQGLDKLETFPLIQTRFSSIEQYY